MAKIKVKNLQCGMILTEDVCDPNGRFLLGKGCELDEKHITALTAWGVISIEIDSDDLSITQDRVEVSPERYAAIEKQIQSRFRHNDLTIPFINELYNESINYFVERLEE